MKIIKYLIASSLVVSMSAFSSGKVEKKAAMKKGKDTYKVNTAKSKLVWNGKKVTGEHTGTVKLKSGTLKFDGTQLTGGEFVIDMTSINATDLKGEWKDKLDNHLKSDDFFSVGKFKTAKIVIKDAQLGKGGHWDITADLTIKDITKPIMFTANVNNKGSKVMADADIKFNRLDYGVKYNSGKFYKALGDKMIYDDVGIKVNIVAE